MALKSQQELLEEFFLTVQAGSEDLTDDTEGSNLDTIAGAVTSAVAEIQRVSVDEFKKTFIDTAHGPAVTGGADDLQRLLVDHFGDQFARPDPTPGVGVVTFSRPNTDAGDVEILEGTVVRTRQNAAGSSQRFKVLTDVTLTGTSINASVEALVDGPSGNVLANTVVEIETALTDPTVTVNNAAPFSGGANTLTDAEYRQFARNLLKSLGGGSIEAIEAAAKTVAGVVTATGIEFIKIVKEWDVAADDAIGNAFRIVYPVLYIGDANGNASQPLKDAVAEAIEDVRAAGIQVHIEGFVAVSLNWTATITLDPSGPNYADLSVDPQPVIDSMILYLQNLTAGADFVKSTADAAILAEWAADLTNFVTSVPAGDVSIDANEKIIPGTVGLT
jgi:hypothetical protein